jgi:uncharacterized protein YbaR (Trm112 family)
MATYPTCKACGNELWTIEEQESGVCENCQEMYEFRDGE